MIKKEFLPSRIRTESDRAVERSADTPFEGVVKDMIIMKYGLDGAEMKIIEKMMQHYKGNREDAARVLEIPERTFYRKLDEWRKRLENAGLEVPEYIKRKERREM